MNQVASPQGNFKSQESIGETLLDKEKMSRNEDTVTFNITYYLAFMVFKNIRSILKSSIFYLHQTIGKFRKVFTDFPRIVFKNGKSLKDHLVRPVLPKIDVADKSGPCCGKRPPCELCKQMKKTSTFKKRNSEEIYHIHKPLNCNFKNTVECSNVECIMLETILW